jgi:hypothetical protein
MFPTLWISVAGDWTETPGNLQKTLRVIIEKDRRDKVLHYLEYGTQVKD